MYAEADFAFDDSVLVWVTGREEVHLGVLLPGDALDGIEAGLGVVFFDAVNDGEEIRIGYRDMVWSDSHERTMLAVELDRCQIGMCLSKHRIAARAWWYAAAAGPGMSRSPDWNLL